MTMEPISRHSDHGLTLPMYSGRVNSFPNVVTEAQLRTPSTASAVLDLAVQQLFGTAVDRHATKMVKPTELIIHQQALYSANEDFCVCHMICPMNTCNLAQTLEMETVEYIYFTVNSISMDEDQCSKLSAVEFDPNIYASNAVGANKVAESSCFLNEKIRDLDAEIFQHVAKHHHDLLRQATDIDNMHNLLVTTETKITTLSSTMGKLSKRISTPHAVLQSQIGQFRNLQQSCELLRVVARIGLLVKRVQLDWEGILILESYRRSVEKCREDLVSQAWNLVNTSYELADQVQLGLGLQVFQNLDQLDEVVCETLKKWQDEFTSFLAVSLDINALTQRVRSRQSGTAVAGPGRASLPGGQHVAFCVTLWTSLDETTDKMERLLAHCRLLGLTLLKKRGSSGSITGVNPILRIGESVEPNPSLAELLLHTLLTQKAGCDEMALRSALVLLFTSVNLNSLDHAMTHKYCDQLTPELDGIQSNISEFDQLLRASEGFIGWTCDSLSRTLVSAAEKTPQVKEALEGEYPKLLKLVLDLGRRIHHTQSTTSDWHAWDTRSGKATATHGSDSLPDYCMLRALSPFETAYLSRSLSRLFDRVSMAFSTSHTPIGLELTDLDGIVQSAASELAYATVQGELLHKVARNVAKTVALFASKVEGLTNVGPDASQVVDSQTVSQKNNIRLVNTLCAFGTQLGLACSRRLRTSPGISTLDANQAIHSPFEPIYQSLESRLGGLSSSILNPLLQSMGDAVEELMSTMHGENFSISSKDVKTDGASGKSPSTSNYMRQLQDFFSRVKRQYFSELSKPPANPAMLAFYSKHTQCIMDNFSCGERVLQLSLQPFLTRWIDVFLYNASLVRPISEYGCLRLSTDCAEFELAITSLLSSSSLAMVVPDAYAKLRAFRPLLLADTESIMQIFNKSEEEGCKPNSMLQLDVLPRSLICQHLFSRAPEEIRAPHETAGWSTSQYISWVLARTEESERLSFLRNGLAAYAHEVQIRQQREYPPMYLVLRSCLQQNQQIVVAKGEPKLPSLVPTVLAHT